MTIMRGAPAYDVMRHTDTHRTSRRTAEQRACVLSMLSFTLPCNDRGPLEARRAEVRSEGLESRCRCLSRPQKRPFRV